MAGVVAVFGGSGGTGRDVIAAALRRGVAVRALYRPGSEPREVPPGLKVLTGQLSAAADVRRTLEGSDGAICVFGPRLGGLFSKPLEAPTAFCAAATANVVAEMRQLGVRRLVCQTGAMAGDHASEWSGGVRRFVRNYRRKFPEIAEDRDEQERVVAASGLDWTIVKPFRISPKRGVGQMRAAPAIRISMLTSIRRQDLADLLVREVTGGQFHRQAVFAVKG